MADEEKEKAEAEERSSPSGAVVYHAIRSEGEEELERPTSALMWSGLAAGLSMGFSFVTQALLRYHIPEASWRPLIVNFGYSVGFLIVVLGRQQIFTENTLTVILPLLVRRDGSTLRNVARLWVVVFLANIAGALLFALVLAKTTAFDSDVIQAFTALGDDATRAGFPTPLPRAILGGWLIALMVCPSPSPNRAASG